MRLEILPLLIHLGGVEFNLAETQVVGTKQASFRSWKAAKRGLSNFEATTLMALVNFCQYLGRILFFFQEQATSVSVLTAEMPVVGKAAALILIVGMNIPTNKRYKAN